MENHYKAKEGFTYQRIVDGFIMGNELYLGDFIDGTLDKIENYEEVEDPDYNEDDETKLRRNNYEHKD